MIYDLEPDYEYRNIEQSIAHHRDLNTPQKLDATTIAAFEETDEIKMINQRIAYLTSVVTGQPQFHNDLVVERTNLYSRKAKRLLA